MALLLGLALSSSSRFIGKPRFVFRCSCTSARLTDMLPIAQGSNQQQQQQQQVAPKGAPSFQQAIQRLQEYWGTTACALLQPCNSEVGAGTMNPATFLRVLGPEPWNAAYVEPSVRPDDSRYGENPNRVQQHHQFQVVLKPDPGNAQELYLGSLAAMGIDVSSHDIRFVEDNWESPVLGAWGLGWEVWMDGMEITQFTYFQQAGGIPLMPVTVEITYGLERILMSLQDVDHFTKIMYSNSVTYGELFLENERQMSVYNLDEADVEKSREMFDSYETQAHALLKKELPVPAYSFLLKASHVFNVLDARGEVGIAQRASYFGRMRILARKCAQMWLKNREGLGYPLGLCTPAAQPSYKPDRFSDAGRTVSAPSRFVLEIGSEELPPDEVAGAISQLGRLVSDMLDKERLSHGEVSVQGTPRRLAVVVESLAAKQEDAQLELKGPPVAKAYHSDGSSTKALEGFCKRNGISSDEVQKKVEGKVEYVSATITAKGKNTLEVLSDELPGLLANIHFRKNMKWNSDAYQYSRPVRWILALFGDEVVPFSYAGVASGRMSRVLRTSPAPVRVATAAEYEKCVEEAGITLSMEQRCQNIWEASCSLAETIGGKLLPEDRDHLLHEVANLVEKPSPLLGYFDSSFLELPADVLTTVMRKHQRYFPVAQAPGQLLPAFVAIANGNINEEVVRRGNEAVLRARYEDAKFFYNKDTSKPLVSYRPQLQGVVFHEKLGSMLDKAARVEKLVPQFARLLKTGDQALRTAQEAGALLHADLATSLVKEFTSLAGTMGRHYALREGYSKQVADAVFESMLPRTSADGLPASDAGRLLSLADKLDSLVGLFTVGGKPTPSSDSFNLRRTAYGVVRTLVEAKLDLDLKQAVEEAACLQPLVVPDSDRQELLSFVCRRLEQLLVDEGAKVEFVRAVLAERGHRPALSATSVWELQRAAEEGKLAEVVEAYSRPSRIIRGKQLEAAFEFDEGLFREAEEAQLWEAYKQVSAQLPLREDVDVSSFVAASRALVDPLQRYFDAVFVMDKEDAVRNNRLAMLARIASLPSGIVDLSLLPGLSSSV